VALTFGQKAGWGLADMGIVVFVVVKQLLVLLFLTSYLGVPVGIAGMVTTAVLIFDMISDPIIGYLSDRTQSRFGRRAPWMAVGAVVMTAGIFALFWFPDGKSLPEDLALVTVSFGVATIGFTMVAIPFSAQAGEMTQDPQERSTMTGWRMGFASLGILIGGAVVPVLADIMGFANAVLAVSPLIVGAIWVSLFATRNAPRFEQSKPIPLKAAYGLVFENKAFMVLVALYGVMTLAIALITAGLPFAALYLINDAHDNLLSYVTAQLGTLSMLFAAFVLGSIISQAFWVRVSHKIGKLSALQGGLVLYVTLLCGLLSILPSVNVTVVAGMFVLAGFANGSYQQIPWAIYPDLMDVTRLKSGAAIEGAFSAVWLFGQKLANALAPALLGFVLAQAGWQESTTGVVEQIPSALIMLQIAITLIPAAILVVSLLGLGLVYGPLQRAVLGR
jgi:GPH family glycoside/pentoside/hexuronide:cation symporter